MKRILKIVLPALLCVLPLRGQNPARELLSEVRFFTDSLQAGRGVGTPGVQGAVFYLLRQLRDAGLMTTVQSFDAGGRAGHNVVAVTPGWFRSYIVVGAYLDGLGTLEGVMYPGADANASGLVALLTLARSLPAACNGPTGLIFVAYDGHHADLAGSRAFLERYRRQYKIVRLVNLDILGSSLAPVNPERSDYLIALGGAPFRKQLEAANGTAGLDLSFDYYGSSAFTELFYRKISDQRWALEAGIPSVMFTSGITLNTNKPADTAPSLNYPVFLRRIRLISDWLSELVKK